MSTTRRIPLRQPLKSTQLPDPTTVEQLANQLTAKLAITGTKWRSKDGEPPADSKLLSMRAVNTASQALSGIVQTGWKKSTSDASSKVTLSTVIASESSATKHLTIIRSISPGEVDVERAATSVLGKLITLEMFELADKALTEIHSGLCTLLNTTQTTLTSLSIPVPSTLPTDPIILNLIATYLSYALVIKARLAAENAKSTQDFATLLEASTTRSLLTWLPNFGALPAKSLDAMLTRVYTAINKMCSSSSVPSSSKAGSKVKPFRPSTPPESLFNLRLYALRCLVHTSPGVIGANAFWDQAIRSVAAFVKSTSSATEEETTHKVLSVFSELVQLAGNRSDRQMFTGVGENGQSFVEMCEYWTTFAKRAGDISVLQKIDTLMQQPSTSSNPPSPIKISQNPLPTTNTPHSPDIILEGTKVCNTFAQLSLLLEAPQTDANEMLVASIKSSTRLLQSSSVPVLLQPSLKSSERRSRDEEQLSRMSGKVDRAFEKLRRISIKYLESLASSSGSSTVPASNIEDALRKFLLQCVAALESQAASSDSTASTTRDILTRCIDTLFVLSRTVLAVNNPKTFVPAFEQLTHAVTILDSVPANKFPAHAEDVVDVANYTRCISGAFYNLAGSLYQATRYGNAVPFLIEACSLGNKALQLPRPEQPAANEMREKEWTQLEEQLFRRWELLAVCYSKNGDRKNAYNAFKQAIHTFPFASSGLKSQSDKQPPAALFGIESSSAVKQLVALVDKVTYLGACDLLLRPEDISLLSAADYVSSVRLSNATIIDSSVIGALLERQLDSLEPNRWKEGIQAVFIHLLRDVLQIYTETMPMRRARVLIRCMEFMYQDRGEEACRDLGVESVDEIGQQVEHLCTRQTWGKDTQLAHFAPQYRIAAHLWVALHVHRRADPGQTAIISQRADEACQIMKAFLIHGSDTSPKAPRHATSSKVVKKIKSPKVSHIASPRTTRATRQRVPAAPRKAAPAKGKSQANVDPMTPKVQTKVLQPVTFTAVKTPRESGPRKQNVKPILEFDAFDRFLSLLQSSARVLGFLSLILTKARLLDMTRQLAQQQSGTTSDGYVIASLDLAHEYATLGKLKRAANIFNQALDIVRRGQASEEAAIRFLLRFAESLALFEDVPKSSSIYLEALELSKVLDLERKAATLQQRVHSRVKLLEISATAAHVFALVQFAGGDLYASLEGLLQALRLWNRAVDTLTRLNPPRETSPSSAESDPFEMSSLKDALPLPASGGSTQGERVSKKPADRRTPLDGLEWRISEGLLSTMLALAQTYYMRGSAREAEYFSRQAAELAEHLNAPATASRALARQGEIQMHMGHMEDAQASLTKAADLLCHVPGIDAAYIHHLKAELNSRLAGEESPSVILNATLLMLEELDESFSQLDNDTFRSLALSPKNKDHSEVLAPELLASILSQQLWLLRDDVDDSFNSLLEKFLSLSYSTHSKAEENILMAKLTLHGVYDRFRTDMFLSSLTESPIAVPIGMGSKDQIRSMIPSAEISNALANAEKLLWAHLHITAVKGNVVKVREAATSLVLIGAFRTSLGDRRVDIPSIIVSLLDASAALTLRRDILEAIEHKFPPRYAPDDLQWPLLSQNGISIPRPNTAPAISKRLAMTSLSDSEDDGDVEVQTNSIKQYWDTVREKYKSQILDPSVLSSTEAAGLPSNWTIINISVTSDKSTLFIARQEGGRECKVPLIFCIPLKGRRDQSNSDDDEQLLTFDGAIQELHDIIRSSDECTKSAINIKSDDEEGRSNWWKQRGQLDVRMRELLENIEYCWLGAFKAILNPQPEMPPQAISDLRSQFESVFHRALRVKDKKPPKAKTSVHKKSASQSQSNVPNQFTLDDSMVKCFSTLSPKCRDEELEDLIYFVLDLYQFHGVPIAIAEVDIVQLVIDLRAVLEEYAAKASRQNLASRTHAKQVDEHVFLVLDKNVQGLPWESMPILRGRSVSRIPGIQFLQDRLAFAKWKRESNGLTHEAQDGAVVDRRKGYYILNPSGDLGRTEERFRNWANGMKASGWDGVIGKKLTEQQFVAALKSRDLVVYFGHGGGEQYVRSHMIRNLPTCAATMLWGCSSGALRDMGDFDRSGTPYNYMLAGCPTLVANLWDVTDKDIDKISQSVFDKLGLTGKEEQRTRTPASLVAAVAQSRDSCKLKYLTGAAPVVYGIPFYL